MNNDRPLMGSSVFGSKSFEQDGWKKGTYHDTTIENASHDSRTRAGGLGQWHTAGVEGRITVVVGEVEARHLG
jgi:hypothetical protein